MLNINLSLLTLNALLKGTYPGGGFFTNLCCDKTYIAVKFKQISIQDEICHFK